LSLLSRLARAFDSMSRQRGVEYFIDGRVQIEADAPSRIVATVRGTTRYKVDLQRVGTVLEAFCTCPRFLDRGLCKHIWAVLLVAEKRPLIRDLEGLGEVEIVEAELDDNPFDEPPPPDAATLRGDRGNGYASPYGQPTSSGTQRMLPGSATSAASQQTPEWRRRLASLTSPSPASHLPRHDPWPETRELLYVIDAASTLSGDSGLNVQLLCRDRKKDGVWAVPKARSLFRSMLNELPDADDRAILSSLVGATAYYGPAAYGYGGAPIPTQLHLVDPHPELLVPAMCRTGRCRVRVLPEHQEEQWLRPSWDDSAPWELRLAVRRPAGAGQYELHGILQRGAERMDLGEPVLLLGSGILFTEKHAARLEHHGAFQWIVALRREGTIRFPEQERDELLGLLLRQPTLPPLDLPDELRFEEIALAPRPRLLIKPNKENWRREMLIGELSFDYAGVLIEHGASDRAIVQERERRVILRDCASEQAAEERLQGLGWRWVTSGWPEPKRRLELAATRLADVVRELTAAGWHVEADGKIYRAPGEFRLNVTSGVDWFELHGSVDFGGATAELPELLRALKRGASTILLSNGSVGILPEEWLKKYGLLAGLGVAHEGHLRFTRSQAGLLDALLAAEPAASCDAVFTQVREELSRFSGIKPVEAPAGFRGKLRPYQKESLGWFAFLRKFGFGGCLADDMGLGKTVQVLALLEQRRKLRAGPSLVVVPRSLIFNWKNEAARFAPKLRVLDYTGSMRGKESGRFEDFDVVLTTYGTLRNDIGDLRGTRFDYVILDEAQAIKNADSASAKCARLLRGEHRLALSGTPIENHLGELWSLFEFLNPGMLGAASVFKLTQGSGRNPDEDTRKLLAQALRPFLLRRTKDQVVRDLPAKVEQTLYCELEGKQRKLYDELRNHYRTTLLKRVASTGIGRAKIQILEALLRLRQAAIHPGLLDERRAKDRSAKLDILLERLEEVLDEGHKTLVFSQFTGMLGLLRGHLDAMKIPYEYLDGKTRDREARVERFQKDPDCRLFLISLKAGGVGLNLTAAQYVFLLDPWWNPAVEAQAVDRAHRIGQANQVFAYRIIARDTVEEKVLELQNTKRDLADAIVNADNALIRDLGREELEMLLS
jgi:superfamily II DNA or RNA helicase